jgi:hypothetical protein
VPPSGHALVPQCTDAVQGKHRHVVTLPSVVVVPYRGPMA